MQATLKGSGGSVRFSSLALKAVQAALIAAPVVLAVAPSQAGTRVITAKGFTGDFAAANWFGLVNGGGQAVFTADTLSLQKPATSSGQSTRQLTITQALVDNLKSPAAYGDSLSFQSATVSFNWVYSVANGATANQFSFNAVGPYTTPNNNPVVGGAPLNKLNVGGTSPESGGGTSPVTLAVGDTFGVQLARNGGVPTGAPGEADVLISDFEFAATYEVPGPLPILGAGAAFAWSRKLRNRLKVSNSIG
jgi:hypothetical protein